MSFKSENQYFLQFEYQNALKGLSLTERKILYEDKIRSEVIRRIKKYWLELNIKINHEDFNKLSNDLFSINHAELELKTAFYKELIELFSEFDFELIIISIYFEINSKQLFQNLHQIILNHIPSNFIDNFDIIDYLKKNNTYTTVNWEIVFLRELIGRYLNVSINDLELGASKSSLSILEILREWFSNKIIEDGAEFELKYVLFHFTKLWNLKFVNPYDERSGIILINKLFLELTKTMKKNKVNIIGVLTDLKGVLENLFSIIQLPPYLEVLPSAQFQRIIKLTGYLNQLNNFNDLLQKTQKYLKDYNKLPLIELVKIYFNSDEQLQSFIYNYIKPGNIHKAFQNEEEKSYLWSIINNHDLKDEMHLKEYIIKTNYWYSAIMFE